MVKQRDIGIMVVLWVVTLGLYGLVWLYATSDELMQHSKKSGNPLAVVLLALIPPLNVFVIWWHAVEVARMSASGGGKGMSEIRLFVWWFPWLPVIPTVGAILSQIQMNKRASSLGVATLWPDI